MNILLTSYYYKPHFGGIENSLYNLAKIYKNKGHNVLIVSSDADITKKGRLKSIEVIDGFKVVRFKRFIPRISFLFFLCPIIDLLKSYFLFKYLSKNRNFDIIIARNHIVALALHCCGIKPINYLVPNIVGNLDTIELNQIKYVSFKHKLKSLYIEKLIVKQNHFIQKIALKKVCRVFVFSNTMKNQIHKLLKTESIMISKINPGVNFQKFQKLNASENKRILGLKNNYFYFLCLGRIINAKGFDLAINALNLLNCKNSALLIVGDGPEVSNLKILADKLEISKRVLFFPFTDQQEIFYSVAHAFLMTSKYESFGQTIIESFAAGIPVIAFDSKSKEILTASSEIVEDNINGYICDYSTDSLAKSMEKIILDQNYSRFKELNIKKAKENYSWEKMYEEILLTKTD